LHFRKLAAANRLRSRGMALGRMGADCRKAARLGTFREASHALAADCIGRLS